jgi:hypothetical protein
MRKKNTITIHHLNIWIGLNYGEEGGNTTGMKEEVRFKNYKQDKID